MHISKYFILEFNLIDILTMFNKLKMNCMGKMKFIFIFILLSICEITFSQAFIKVTDGVIVNDGGWSYAMCWADFNNDSFQDLFVTNNNSSNKNNMLYFNDGSGGFIKIATGSVVSDGGSSYGCTVADVDNDGDIDLFVSNYNENNFFYLNNGNGSFTKVTTGNIVINGGKSVGCSFGDYDNDGYVDLYVANRDEANFLYKNNGNSTFTKITSGEIVTDVANSGGCAWGDYDNDGYIDLYVANGTNDCLYINNGNGTFTKIINNPVVTESEQSTGGSWGDYDDDGDLDLYVTGGLIGSSYNRLFKNNGDGTFTKILNDPIVNPLFWSGGSAWGDCDNDGDNDMFAGGYDGVNRLYLNNNNGTFTSMDTGILVTDGNYKKGCGWCDYDKDGDIDIFTARNNYFGGNNCFYKNLGNSNKWINIKCVGVVSNKCGVGTKIYVKANINGTVKRQLKVITTQSGGNQSGINDLNPTFGLGNAAFIDSIIVVWQSGTTDRIGQTPVNQFVTITEGQGITLVKHNGTVAVDNFRLIGNYPNPFNPSTKIRFEIPKQVNVKIDIFDVTGKLVEEIVKGLFEQGTYEVNWNSEGRPSGTYFCRLTTEDFSETKIMILLK